MFKFLASIVILTVIVPFLARALARIFLGDPAQGRSRQSQNASSRMQQPPAKKKKVIGEDEGEYVDYEEVKD